jgi:hypothetical protein
MESQPISPGGKPDIAPARKPTVSNESVKKASPTPPASGVEDTVTLSNQSKQVLSRPPQSAPSQTAEASDNKKLLSVTDNNDVVMKVIDKKTQEVVKQIPSEEQLNLKDAIRNVVDDITPSDS